MAKDINADEDSRVRAWVIQKFDQLGSAPKVSGRFPEGRRSTVQILAFGERHKKCDFFFLLPDLRFIMHQVTGFGSKNFSIFARKPLDWHATGQVT